MTKVSSLSFIMDDIASALVISWKSVHQNSPKNDFLKGFEIYWKRFIQEYISMLYARKVTKLSCIILKKKPLFNLF